MIPILLKIEGAIKPEIKLRVGETQLRTDDEKAEFVALVHMDANEPSALRFVS